MAAKSILEVAERVEKALNEAQEMQKNVDDGILTTNENILNVNSSLLKVSNCVVYMFNRCRCLLINILPRLNRRIWCEIDSSFWCVLGANGNERHAREYSEDAGRHCRYRKQVEIVANWIFEEC